MECSIDVAGVVSVCVQMQVKSFPEGKLRTTQTNTASTEGKSHNAKKNQYGCRLQRGRVWKSPARRAERGKTERGEKLPSGDAIIDRICRGTGQTREEKPQSGDRRGMEGKPTKGTTTGANRGEVRQGTTILGTQLV